MSMDRQQREALDRHITGNYGEDQFKDLTGDGTDWDEPYYPDWDMGMPQCQVSNCEEDATNGILCDRHQEQIPTEATMKEEPDVQ